ncbi:MULTISPECIES: rhodanese-like domain-containing protein [Deinococcus]|uniref:Rhodanese-like domain-containing protein n=1 Tax=Deinococcus cavernae TaxID=2320857 RepID=A0A418VAZ1_9DEIO|nr:MULTISPECIES: rhodanese-like domain-containing protein [Deinococcus]RJF73295.1 rhodanese-like domain-containing protein [Deinococcus cavernae]
MPLSDVHTIIDLRPAQAGEPLAGRLPVVRLSMDDIEEGRHALTPAGGPYLVVCERGAHAGLAARYLRADGLNAEAWTGTPAALGQALRENE